VRIAFVPAARLLTETEPNGEGLIASALIRRLAARGHEILAYCERSTLPPIDGVEVREIPADGPTAAIGRIRFAKRIARDAARERFDVAHLLFPFNTAEGYSLVRGAPLVAGPINVPWPRAAGRRARAVARAANAYTGRIERRLHAKTLARAKTLFVTGGSSYAAMPEHVRGRCAVVPFGVDVDRFRLTPMPARPTILFLSVLQERKGIEVLLRAMPQVARCAPSARLIVAGADPEGRRFALERLADDLGIASHVEFAGPVAPDEAPTAYAHATVLSQPSFGEPFGMTVIEAMACGRPVVATTGGGIPDAVIEGSGGRLVPPGDERLLGDALCSILAEEGVAERLGGFNRARALERYDIEHVVDEMERTYREVTGDAKGVDLRVA